jgi:hypothetical protein
METEIQEISKHTNLFIHSFINDPTALCCPDIFFSFVIFFTRTEGLLGRGIRKSQGRYLHTGQHKYRINAHRYIHTWSGIRTHDPSVRAKEVSKHIIKRNL